MGTKKQEEKSKKMWTKVLAVAAGVLFVVLMVVSSLGSSWISSLATVKPGDVVVVDYTLHDAHGKPLVTSNAQLYTQMSSSGSNILYSKQLTLTANKSAGTGIYPIQVYSANSGATSQFALFENEYDAISNGIVGMRPNAQKAISLSQNKPLTQEWSADQLAAHNLDLSSLNVGNILALGVSQNPEAASGNSTSDYYIRLAEITNKSPEGITLDFSYPEVDVTVVSINKATSS